MGGIWRQNIKAEVLNPAFENSSQRYVNITNVSVLRHAGFHERIVKSEMLQVFWTIHILMHLPHQSDAILKLLQTPKMDHTISVIDNSDSDARLLGILEE